MREQRRLAAIVSADVVGYSRLMGCDESGTLSALKAHRRELIDPKIAEYGGRIVKTTGDGLLLEYASVVDAVRCSVDVQRGMRERNADISSDRRIEFRIGINVGDIIIDADDIFGDGVNVAARLQALAQPGGICASRVVRDHVIGKLSFTFESLGAQSVKNIARPVETFRVALDCDKAPRRVRGKLRMGKWLRTAGGALAIGIVVLAIGSLSFRKSASPPPPPALSIAILPFGASQEDAAEGRLADSFNREFTSTFERITRAAKVTAPRLAAQYRGRARDPQTAGRELNVRYLLEGDVRRAANDYAISASLINASMGTQVWHDSVRLDLLSSEERRSIAVGQLASMASDALWRAEIGRSGAPPSKEATPVDLMLHGSAVLARDDNTVRGAREARQWFDRALLIDPDYMPALIGRVQTLEYELDFDPQADRERLVQEMDRLTFRAVAVAPDYTSAWKARAWTMLLQWRWDASLEAIGEAERWDPTKGWWPVGRETIMVLTGQPEAALHLVDEQFARGHQKKDDTGWGWLQRCRAYVALARYDDAIASCQANIALDNWWLPHVYLLAAYAQKGETSKAQSERTALLGLRPTFSIAEFNAQRFSDNPSFLQQTEDHLFPGLRKAGIPER